MDSGDAFVRVGQGGGLNRSGGQLVESCNRASTRRQQVVRNGIWHDAPLQLAGGLGCCRYPVYGSVHPGFPGRAVFLSGGFLADGTGTWAYSDFGKRKKAVKGQVVYGNMEFFVAKNGDDRNNGSKNAPFASIVGARNAIRKFAGNLPEGGVTVTVMPGEYPVWEGICFDERDSGTGEKRICYRASNDGTVCLNSGVTLDWADFQPVSEEVKKRLISPKARVKVRQLDLKAYGLTEEDWGKMYAYGAYTTADKYEDGKGPMYCELFCGEERMTLCRYPNDGYLQIQKVLDNGDASETYDTGKTVKLLDKWDAMRSPRGGTFLLDREAIQRIRCWAPDDDRWIFGFFKWDWADASTRIARLDVETGALTTEHAACYGFTEGGHGQGGRFYFYNILEELDRPGEWYLDRKAGMLYFYPPEGAEEKALTLTVSNRDILTISHADYLTFSGFCLKGSRGSAVTAIGNGNRIEHCSISLMGGGGIEMTGEENQVTQCEICHVGSFGIKLSGGNRQTLQDSRNAACRNHIHH